MSTFVNDKVDLVIAHDELTTLSAEMNRKIKLDATVDESDDSPPPPPSIEQEKPKIMTRNGERTRRSLSLTPLTPCEYVPVYANRITINGDDIDTLPSKQRATRDMDTEMKFVRNTPTTSTRKFTRNANGSTRRSLYCDTTECEAIYSLYRPVSYSHISELGACNKITAAEKEKTTIVTVRSSDVNYRSIKLKRKQLKPLNDDSPLMGQLHRSRTEDNISNIVVDDEPETLKRMEMKSCEVLSKFDEDLEEKNRIRIMVKNNNATNIKLTEPQSECK